MGEEHEEEDHLYIIVLICWALLCDINRLWLERTKTIGNLTCLSFA